VSVFYPENGATTVFMQLESHQYYQGKQNVEAYIDEFKNLIKLSGYTYPIAIMPKFHKGLNLTELLSLVCICQRIWTLTASSRLPDTWTSNALQMRPSIMPPNVP
jgi:hypothetical protein